MKAFPRGATPIDFAYSIHTDVGHQCVGARVNGKMVPLRARLKNGDIVEIVTSSGHKPSRDWLNFVVTSHARYKIKHLIRLEERTRAVELGRKVFEKEARRYDVPLKGVHRHGGVRQGAGRRRRQDAGRRVRADRLRDAVGEAAAGASSCPPTACARRRPTGRSPPPSSARSAAARRRSRCAARTTCWCSGRAAATRFAARRSSATSRAARASRSIPRPVRTSSTCCTTRSAASRWSGTRRERRRPAAPYTVKLTMEVEDRKGAAGGRQRQDRRHQHEHQEHGSADRRSGPARADRRHRRDQRSQAPRAGHQVAEIGERCAGRRTGGNGRQKSEV